MPTLCPWNHKKQNPVHSSHYKSHTGYCSFSIISKSGLAIYIIAQTADIEQKAGTTWAGRSITGLIHRHPHLKAICWQWVTS